jgi:protein-disulfide isomerase
LKRYLPFIIIGGVLAVALGAGFTLYRSAKPSTGSQTLADATPTPSLPPGGGPRVTPASQTGPVPAADNAHVRGPANAKITMEEYGDYQCPSCGVLYPELKKLEQEYGSQMRFVFRHFPLQAHKYALLAAHAAEAASQQGRFWEMHDMIYTNQANWANSSDARPIFIEYARNLGLDVDRFTRDLDDPAIAARVQADYQRGVAVHVEGTPTLFLNGRQLRPEAYTPEGLHMALDYLLGKKSQ